MKKLITFITALIISQNLISQMAEISSDINLNVGFAIDNAEQTFVENHGYQIGSIYQNYVSFVEIAISSTNYESMDSSYFKTGGAMTFKYFYPNTSNDSIRSRYSGNLFGFDLLGVNILPLTSFADIIFTGGVNMGSKKVRIGSGVKYKNFIFAPRLTSEVRFRFAKKWSITARVEKQFDVSKPIWKLKKGNDLLDLTEMKYSPLMFSAGIGWKIG